ncbi:hypothetical protein [Sporosarcina sp. ITBMC105]
MKEIKKPFTLYYESRFLRGVALLDKLETHVEAIQKFLSTSSVSDECFNQMIHEHQLLITLLKEASKCAHSYNEEVSLLILNKKLEKDFYKGEWEPEYY